MLRESKQKLQSAPNRWPLWFYYFLNNSYFPTVKDLVPESSNLTVSLI